MLVLDAHAHLPADHERAALLFAELDVRVMNISIGLDAAGCWRKHPTFGSFTFEDLARKWPRHFAWCTSFDVPTFDTDDYAERVISGLERDFANGATAVKVWKNVGLELLGPSARHVLIDDPVFSPIFDRCARRGWPVILHVGEPRACWRPLDEESPHAAYYRDHPEWHMYARPDVPSHEELMKARDRVVARHPAARFIGAHLASLEYDVRELARTLDALSNFAVDTAARRLDLAFQPRDRVRGFFDAYQDRILFGTDLLAETEFSRLAAPALEAELRQISATYRLELDFYATDEMLHQQASPVRGLALPPTITRKLFAENARTWLGL
jgi:predicted TIM-barrel fold metal-dependent hydrolase